MKKPKFEQLSDVPTIRRGLGFGVDLYSHMVFRTSQKDQLSKMQLSIKVYFSKHDVAKCDMGNGFSGCRGILHRKGI